MSLEHGREQLQKRVATLERKQRLLQHSLCVLQSHIAAEKDTETRYFTQIAGLVGTIANGEVVRTQMLDQDTRQALCQVPGKMYSKLPPAGERSLAFMMLSQARLGANKYCLASDLAGQTDVIQMISNMCLKKSTLDIQEENCQTLMTMVQNLLQKQPSSIIELVENAVNKSRTMWTAEQGVVSNIDAISIVDIDVAQTLRHAQFSREFQCRNFQERREIKFYKRAPLRALPPVSKRIANYVSRMVESINTFSAGLIAINMAAGASGLLCVRVKQLYDANDLCGETVVPTTTQGVSLTAPAVSVQLEEDFTVCQISLYNLGDKDLVFSGNPITQSAQLHEGNFLFRRKTDGEVPKHDCNTLPAGGIAFLEGIEKDGEEINHEFHLKDVDGNVVVTFTLQFAQ